MRFRCLGLPSDTAARWRATGRDDRGNALIARVADGPGSAPCRHCLRYAEPGEAMLLGSFDLPRPHGIYWTPSPVFLHAHDCPRFEAEGVVAPTATGPDTIVSVRSYDAAGMCLYDLGQVCRGPEVEAPLLRALADARTAFVNIHTARPGCWLATAERLDAPRAELP
ncbi:DUF1203 domain-containing protein [Falsiroseomonas oryziterrae]|uniref:DUF1203 domain-containing protein n=1 Tax=Falsiroseomonas oryziterrae TaxID=2911368 RepID=UPI001F38307A|nr:DUF1203 domain-containing protein [Roseomonas sp. NPKOSM-4]